MNIPTMTEELWREQEPISFSPNASTTQFRVNVYTKEFLNLGPYKFEIKEWKKEGSDVYTVTLRENINYFPTLDEAMAALIIDGEERPFFYPIRGGLSAGPDWPFKVFEFRGAEECIPWQEYTGRDHFLKYNKRWKMTLLLEDWRKHNYRNRRLTLDHNDLFIMEA